MGWEQADKFLERTEARQELQRVEVTGIPFNERRIRPEGLKHCCTTTWRLNKDATVQGSIIPCRHCRLAMVVAGDGVVERNVSWRK